MAFPPPQTVAQILTAATDSVTLINDINTNGADSIYAGATIEPDGTVVASTWTQAEINYKVQQNVNHLEIILAYDGNGHADVAGDSADKSSYTGAVTTGNTYITNNS
jgi:hypothetical protein